jgi:hypothetical protein
MSKVVQSFGTSKQSTKSGFWAGAMLAALALAACGDGAQTMSENGVIGGGGVGGTALPTGGTGGVGGTIGGAGGMGVGSAAGMGGDVGGAGGATAGSGGATAGSGGMGPVIPGSFVNLAPEMGTPLPMVGDTVTPAPPTGWAWHNVEGTFCRDGSPNGLYVRNTGSDKLLIYFEGGGACTTEERRRSAHRHR